MRPLVILFLFFLTGSSLAQDYSSFRNTIISIQKIATVNDSTERNKQASDWWAAIRKADHIPFTVEDSVMFLYRGAAKSVEWMGDFNGWGYDKKFYNKGTRIVGTDIWVLKTSFPKDARLDYKIVIDGTNWILDPDNIHQQWSGVGGGSPNSELRMPSWKEDKALLSRNDIHHGTVKTDILYTSKVLGYQITYCVYLPFDYEKLGKLPTVYVTDGYEYMHPQLGNMITILDNLIADKKIKPVMAVFVDNREPVNRSNNKRMQELAMNNAYLDFFTKELIPEIEKNYPALSEPSQRAILGTSMGGLTSTYFAFMKPDVFGMAGIQSPAFWTKPQIYSLCTDKSNPTMKISMTSGLINDTSKESRKMKDVLESSSCVYHYHEVNEGHSWGNWRNLIDDILVDFFAAN